jgi:hypothetical protein
MIDAVGLVMAGWLICPPSGLAQHANSQGPLNTLADVNRAIRGCWHWPPASDIRTGMELTVRLSFKRDGEIFGAHVTYQTRDVSPQERTVYYRALVNAIGRCSPLPVTPALGEAIAGRPFYFHFHDTRKQRKASLNG